MTWKDFLKEEIPHSGEFQQHMLIMDFAENNTAELPTNFNRFITGAITFDIIGSKNALFTFAKLGRFIIFGVIQKGPDRWINTKVHIRHGVLKPGTFTAPIGILDILKAKAGLARSAMEMMSKKQQNKISDEIMSNTEKFTGSEQFQAFLADAEMFGLDAIIKKK